MRSVLLITGSRHFVTDGEDWCRDELMKILRYLPHSAVVLHGGAKGPDTWADEHARALGLGTVCYLADGTIRAHGVSARPTWGPIVQISREAFLARDRALVATARRCLQIDPVVCVGFRHLGSKTHGTEYTLRLAREAGLWTEERVLR